MQLQNQKSRHSRYTPSCHTFGEQKARYLRAGTCTPSSQARVVIAGNGNQPRTLQISNRGPTCVLASHIQGIIRIVVLPNRVAHLMSENSDGNFRCDTDLRDGRSEYSGDVVAIAGAGSGDFARTYSYRHAIGAIL